MCFSGLFLNSLIQSDSFTQSELILAHHVRIFAETFMFNCGW